MAIAEAIQTHRSFAEAEPDPKARKARLKAMIAAFDKLEGQFNAPHVRMLDKLIRGRVLAELGMLLGYSGLERLAKTPITSPLSWDDLDERDRQERAIDFADLERRTAAGRAAIANRIGPPLIVGLLAVLATPLRRQLDLEKTNKGGRPRDVYRRYAIEQLIPVYEQIYGERPTTTPPRQIHGPVSSGPGHDRIVYQRAGNCGEPGTTSGYGNAIVETVAPQPERAPSSKPLPK
jgi:hypothetical protein